MLTSPKTKAGGLAAETRPSRMRTHTKLIISAVLLTAVALGWRLWAVHGTSEAPVYETAPVALGVVERTVSATGPVKALVTVDVGSQLSGIIAETKADFNDRVKEGDLLAIIDRGPFEAAYASAAANLVIAKADIGLREATVAKAQHQLVQYDRDAGRYRMLAPSGSTSRMQLDQAETLVAITKDDIAIAQAQLESAKGTVSQREAELKQAEIDLNRTLIRSPINGVVIDRKMQPGQTVTAAYQTPVLFQIAQDLSQIQIWAQVDEADIGSVHAGAPVSFTVEAYPDEEFSGKVEQVRLAATKTSGIVTYTVIIKAQNPDQKLFPEMTATVRIVSERRENVLNVPNAALRFHPSDKEPAVPYASGVNQASLWVRGIDGKLGQRAVRPGFKGDRSIEILDGNIKAGEAAVLRDISGSGQEQP
jgi:HlyD family secretion protein